MFIVGLLEEDYSCQSALKKKKENEMVYVKSDCLKTVLGDPLGHL